MSKFPYQALMADVERCSAKTRGLYLDNLLRKAVGLKPKGHAVDGAFAVREERDGFKFHRGGSGWQTKLTTKRRGEPRPRSDAT